MTSDNILKAISHHGFSVEQAEIQPNPRLDTEIFNVSAKGRQWKLVRRDESLSSPEPWLNDWISGLREI